MESADTQPNLALSPVLEIGQRVLQLDDGFAAAVDALEIELMTSDRAIANGC